MTTEVRVSVLNTSDIGGTAFTPLFLGFHDGSFDVYNRGEVASAGLEALAEDGNNAPIAEELVAADADAQAVNLLGTTPAGGPGPIAAGTRASTIVAVDGVSNGSFSFASMLLPSNDAFFGTGEAVQLFDASGSFQGAQTFVFEGSNVLDAGTEVNTELDAAFINQTGPNTGEDENGVVALHPGFNGSFGNPVGDGDQIILGGTNAFGQFIDPEAADFTLPGAEVATVHVNTVNRIEGDDSGEFIRGGRDDDIVSGEGGNDLILGRSGWDVLNGGDGKDTIFGGSGSDEIYGDAGRDALFGGRGNDLIHGGDGQDVIGGGRDDDSISGGDGFDQINGGSGDDVISGGADFDILFGGRGNDHFLFSDGSDIDAIRDYDRRGDDTLVLEVEGVDSYEDAVSFARDKASGVKFDFGDGDILFLAGVSLSDLTEDDFFFI